jgi:DNA-binding Xre family transcriptional regulator
VDPIWEDVRAVEIVPRICGLIPKRNQELDEERTLRLMQGCLSSMGALHGWLDFEEAWEGAGEGGSTPAGDRSRRLCGRAGRARGGCGVTERAVLRLVDEDVVDSAPEVRGARWRLDLASLDRQRVARGWTRAELARRAHVAPATLSCMFRGHRRPAYGTVQALCVALGLELQDVIVFEEEAETAKSVAA